MESAVNEWSWNCNDVDFFNEGVDIDYDAYESAQEARDEYYSEMDWED